MKNIARLAAAVKTMPRKTGARDGRRSGAGSVGRSSLGAAGTLLGREYIVVGASSVKSPSSRCWTASGAGVAAIAADFGLGTGGGVVFATRGGAAGGANAVASVSSAPASA